MASFRSNLLFPFISQSVFLKKYNLWQYEKDKTRNSFDSRLLRGCYARGFG